MPLNKYPWSEKYGWIQDKFGIAWQLMLTKPEMKEQRVIPALMFTKAVAGKAEEAMQLYTSLFPNSSLKEVSRYEKGEGDVEGTVKHGRFTLCGQLFVAMDSSAAHATAVIELTEIARTLDRYAEKLDLDPEQLALLEQRVTLLETLKRKYGGSIPEVIAFGQRAAERMRKIEGRDVELERLAKEIVAAKEAVDGAAAVLRRARQGAAPRLAQEIRQQLVDLGFRRSEFEVQLSPHDEPRLSGTESIELLFSPNPGEPLKPLRTVASSGEISRVMLAIKSALALQDAIPLLVFDEIDANVGGEIANSVGAKMRTLARRHQVLCITHLPQVAAAAAHFVVTKEVAGGRTFSELHEVKGKPRQEEIARMLGGRSESALKHAATLLR